MKKTDTVVLIHDLREPYWLGRERRVIWSQPIGSSAFSISDKGHLFTEELLC